MNTKITLFGFNDARYLSTFRKILIFWFFFQYSVLFSVLIFFGQDSRLQNNPPGNFKIISKHDIGVMSTSFGCEPYIPIMITYLHRFCYAISVIIIKINSKIKTDTIIKQLKFNFCFYFSWLAKNYFSVRKMTSHQLYYVYCLLFYFLLKTFSSISISL